MQTQAFDAVVCLTLHLLTVSHQASGALIRDSTSVKRVVALANGRFMVHTHTTPIPGAGAGAGESSLTAGEYSTV